MPTSNYSKQIPLGHVRYINILTWLWGFQDKLLCLVGFSLYSSLFWELRDKRNFSKNPFLTRKPRSHVRILIYRTWPNTEMSHVCGRHVLVVKYNVVWCGSPADSLLQLPFVSALLWLNSVSKGYSVSLIAFCPLRCLDLARWPSLAVLFWLAGRLLSLL